MCSRRSNQIKVQKFDQVQVSQTQNGTIMSLISYSSLWTR